MSDILTPKEYSSAFCHSVIKQTQDALESAVKTMTLASAGQQELTAQTIKHLESSLRDIKDTLKSIDPKDIEELIEADRQRQKDIKMLTDRVNTLKIWILRGGISALIFLMGYSFSIFKFANSIKTITPGG